MAISRNVVEMFRGLLFEICTDGLPDVELLVESLEKWVREHPEKIDRAL